MVDMQIVKKYLSRILYIDKEIDANQNVAEEFRTKIQSIKVSQAKTINVQESQSNTMEDRVLRYVEMEEEINKMIDDMIKLKEATRKEINQMDIRVHKAVLIRRYINNQSWNDIADEMGYEQRHITRLHGSALQEFYSKNEKAIKKYHEKKMS